MNLVTNNLAEIAVGITVTTVIVTAVHYKDRISALFNSQAFQNAIEEGARIVLLPYAPHPGVPHPIAEAIRVLQALNPAHQVHQALNLAHQAHPFPPTGPRNAQPLSEDRVEKQD